MSKEKRLPRINVLLDKSKCPGHVWRHLCVTTKEGYPSKRNCGGIVTGCEKIQCVNCGLKDKDRVPASQPQKDICPNCGGDLYDFESKCQKQEKQVVFNHVMVALPT